MAKCLKCGIEIKERSAFCPKCLAVLDAYPVKPGTVVHLLPRPKRTELKADAFQESEEKARLAVMRRRVRWLVAVTLVLSALLLLSTGLLAESIMSKPETPPIGRNYTTTQRP